MCLLYVPIPSRMLVPPKTNRVLEMHLLPLTVSCVIVVLVVNPSDTVTTDRDI